MRYKYQYSIQKTTVELNSNQALSIMCVFSIYLKMNMNSTKLKLNQFIVIKCQI